MVDHKARVRRAIKHHASAMARRPMIGVHPRRMPVVQEKLAQGEVAHSRDDTARAASPAKTLLPVTVPAVAMPPARAPVRPVVRRTPGSRVVRMRKVVAIQVREAGRTVARGAVASGAVTQGVVTQGVVTQGVVTQGVVTLDLRAVEADAIAFSIPTILSAAPRQRQRSGPLRSKHDAISPTMLVLYHRPSLKLSVGSPKAGTMTARFAMSPKRPQRGRRGDNTLARRTATRRLSASDAWATRHVSIRHGCKK